MSSLKTPIAHLDIDFNTSVRTRTKIRWTRLPVCYALNVALKKSMHAMRKTKSITPPVNGRDQLKYRYVGL